MACLDVYGENIEIPENMAGKLRARVGEEYITPSFEKHLEDFYNKANPSDQAKCLELRTAIHLGEAVRPRDPAPPTFNTRIPKDIRRCKSAMAKLGDSSSDVFKSFNTTYTREFTPKLGPSAVAHRPATSKGYGTTRDKNGPIGTTLYTEEFSSKLTRPTSPMRTGTSSGDRNNNPHPTKWFMAWRFPSHGRKKYVQPIPCYETLTNEKVNNIHKRLCASTYQKDYLGIPQGFQMKSAFDVQPDWKSTVAYGMDTHHRIAYQNPNQPPELGLPSTRYGSNVNKNKPSIGSIPTINRYLLDLKNKTTYDRHFNENASAVTQQIRDVSRHINIDALEKFYNTSVGDEREIVGKMLNSLKPDRYRQPKYRAGMTPDATNHMLEYNRPTSAKLTSHQQPLVNSF